MSIVAIHDVTPTQQAMLASGSGDTVFLAQVSIDLVGPVNPATVREAWQQIQQRHPILRTGFALEEDGNWLQFEADAVPVAFAEAKDAAALEQHLRNELSRPFALDHPGLIRLACAPVGADRLRIAFTHHHAILDGWSLQLLIAELLEICAALGADAVPRLAPAPGFGRFVEWDSTRDRAAARAFWQNDLASVAASPRLAGQRDFAGSTGTTDAKAVADIDLGASASAAIAGLAQRWKVTGAALIHGIWGIVLAHLLDCDDPVFGSTQSGRPGTLPGADRIVGPFLVTVPFRPRPAAGQSASRWFGAVAALLGHVQEHAALEAGTIRNFAGHVPLGVTLFETVLAVQNYASGQQQLRNGPIFADLTALRVSGGEGRYPLLLGVGLADTLSLRFTYDGHRLNAAAIEAAANLVAALIARLAADGTITIDALQADMPAALRGAWRAGAEPVTRYIPPQGKDETLVASIWSELAGRTIGRDEDFFDSGSHSLLAVELSSQLSMAVRRRISVELIYRHRTVAGIAAELANAEPIGDGSLPSGLVAQPIGDHPFPLTELQRAYWIGRDSSIELGGRPSFATLEIALAEDIDAGHLRNAWQRLRRRHAMLRAVLTPDGQQRIPADDSEQEPRSWFTAEAVTNDPKELDELAARLRDTIAAVVVDAERGPMFSLALLDGPAAVRRLFVAYDPIICDAGSIAVLTRELSILARQPDASLPPIEIEFSDYVRGLAQRIAGAEGDRDRAYWRGRMPSLPPAPELPRRPADIAVNNDENFRRRLLVLDPQQWRALRDLAAQLAVTPTALIIAVYALVLAEWSRRRHFCINLTLFNRQPIHPDVHALVGDFTSLTLLDADLRKVDSIVDAARQIHRRLSIDIDHRLVDGVEVLRWLSQESGRVEVMPVVLTSTLGQGEARSDSRPLGEIVSGYGQTPQVSLDCQIAEHEGSLRCWWDSLDGEFPDGLVETMFAAFAGSLRSLAEPAADLDLPLVRMPAQDAAERSAYNTSSAPFAPVVLLHGFLDRSRTNPDHPALIGAGRTMTYTEVERASRHLAAQIKLVAGPAEPVGILARCPFEMAVASIAVLRSGRAFVRLSPEWPPARCNAVLGIAGASLLLTGLDAETDAIQPALCRLPVTLELAPAVEDLQDDSGSANDLAYIMFTSGSTGAPKGVAITHAAAMNTIQDINARLGLAPRDRILAVSAPTFDLSIYDLFGALDAGASVVLLPPVDRADPDLWVGALWEHGVTVWNSTPSLLQMLCDRLSMDPQAPPGLRAAMVSGDWIPLDLAQRVRQFWPLARMIGMGGATEAAIWSVWEEIAEPLPGWPSVPYGLPLANQTLDVLDERMSPRPVWAVGDLYIGGDGLALGYFGRPDLTAASFVQHPHSGQRLYRTGDLARFRPGGKLEFLGREDGQVKIRGFRIELGEIESLLLQDAGVTAALALVEGSAIHAFVVEAAQGVCNSGSLKRELAGKLPSYAVPATVTVLSAWPLTAHGKVDKAALIAHQSTPAAAGLEAGPGDDPLIVTLAEIAGTVLGRPPVSPDEDLFLAGVDSVTATQIIARFHAQTGYRIALARVFAARTAREIAAALKDEISAFDAELLAGAADGVSHVPASSMQERLWLIDQLSPGDSRYIIPGAITIEGDLDQDCLALALGDLIARHEPLRSVLTLQDGRLVQDLIDWPGNPLAVEHAETATESSDIFATRPFALDREPPARFRLLARAEREWSFEFAIHHVAFDAWSIAVLAGDLVSLYAARKLGESVRPQLPASYRDFAVWERARDLTDQSAASMRWWRSTLAGLPSQSLCSGRIDRAEAAVVPLAMGDDAARALEEFAQKGGTTLFMVLLGVLAVALHRNGAPDDLSIASSTNGRERLELESLVGCFVNIVPHRIRLSGAPDVAAAIRRTRDTVIATMEHRNLPFERIVAAGRSAGANLDPPFAAMFVLQNTPKHVIELDGLRFAMPPQDMDGSRYPLHLHFERDETGLRGALRAEAGALVPGQAQRIAEEFIAIASQIDAASLQPLTLHAPSATGQVVNHASRLAAMLRLSPDGKGGA